MAPRILKESELGVAQAQPYACTELLFLLLSKIKLSGARATYKTLLTIESGGLSPLHVLSSPASEVNAAGGLSPSLLSLLNPSDCSEYLVL